MYGNNGEIKTNDLRGKYGSSRSRNGSCAMDGQVLLAPELYDDRARDAALLHPLRAKDNEGGRDSADCDAWCDCGCEPRAVRATAKCAANILRHYDVCARIWARGRVPRRQYRRSGIEHVSWTRAVDAVADVLLGHDWFYGRPAEKYTIHEELVGQEHIRVLVGIPVWLDYESMVSDRHV